MHKIPLLLFVLAIACGDDSMGESDVGVIEAGPDVGDASIDTSPRDISIDRSQPDVGPGECGDGELNTDEDCDDGNTSAGDGCSETCTSETNYVCVQPGMPCVRIVTCGNGRLEGDETCDDRNDVAGDGCSSDCMVEDGWECAFAGRACTAAACGDGIVAGLEQCDDGNDASGDGCNACELEEGWVCPPGDTCRTTTCGDGVTEGTETCDDGNLAIGDGCTPLCTREPRCTDGTCEAFCGDGAVFAPETCDDGNTRDGDGCSSSCQVEEGFSCEEVAVPDAPEVRLPIVIRDFMGACASGAPPRDTVPGATAPYSHPDFECYNGAEQNVVQTELVGGVPVLNTAPAPVRVTSPESFALWYTTNDDYNRTVAQTMTIPNIGGGVYQFDDVSFYPLSTPLDGSAPAGFVAEGLETPFADGNGAGLQNFFFTSEVRYWFEYAGDEVLEFSGDDDVWVFINGRLAVDIGGVHGRANGAITLADCDDADPAMNMPGCRAPLDLRIGGIYEAVVFQAERHTNRSQYRLTLTNFNRAPSICEYTCGDGVVTRFEACDDGDANGATYNGCSNECTLTPYCGDGIVQEEHGEVCDDGLNLGAGPSACSPGCMDLGARCGDGVVQTEEGEQCDDGNTESGDGCDDMCFVELV